MSEELKAIRERHEREARWIDNPDYANCAEQQMHADLGILLDHIDCKSRHEALRQKAFDAVTAERDEMKARAEAAEAALKKVRDLLEMAESDDHNGYISIADNRRKDALKVVYGAMKGTPDDR